ncbi:MAG: ribonuclease PH [bacterium]|jgi:ribonuclease PH
MKRSDGRRAGDLRKIKVKRNFIAHPEGSVLIEAGGTRIICTASVENRIPPFLMGTGKGWVTAEYSMLPRATHTRMVRDRVRGNISGRSQEIQRLIGRSLRAVVDLRGMPDKTVLVDCDVIQADGGTRTLSITGAYIALHLALETLVKRGDIEKVPTADTVAATSVGMVGGEVLLDLCYEEDSSAGVDFNVVMTGKGRFVEVQGTAEGMTFSRRQMDSMLAVARKGIEEITAIQRKALRIA